jgi:hypothetical protein
MSRPMLLAATILALAGMLPSAPGHAADLSVPGGAAQAPAAAPADCGPCGCLQVSYDYHRELRSTYGTGFDPRNYDETQPHYYFGSNRAWPRYSVYGVGTGSCWN